MRHRKSGIKLNRTASHRKAMFRNMVTSLFKHERIQTTEVKAKALRSWVDHLVTLAKRGDVHARRQALSIIREKNVVHKLFEDASKRFGSISGGYTRIVKLGLRRGDAAPMSLLELVTAEDAGPSKTKKKKPAKAKGRKTAAASVPESAQEQTPAGAAAEPEGADAGAASKEEAPPEGEKEVEPGPEAASTEGDEPNTEEIAVEKEPQATADEEKKES
ncbi:MAG: 50S ribosomal protein L17 [Desulfobacterales bacterium]|nr:50S ribosomal protein L17 [Desulfobacterales bacterium]